MKRLLFAILLALPLTTSANPLAETAQTAVKKTLKDPYSAHFDYNAEHPYMFGGLEFTLACGTVNAKNGFGAYTGNSFYFVTFIKTAPVITNIMTVSDFNSMVTRVRKLPESDNGRVLGEAYAACIGKLQL